MSIASINLEQRLAVATSGEFLPITNLFDSGGHPTTCLDDAVTFVAGPDANRRWFAGRIKAFEQS